MIREITLGQYYPTDSVLHRLDPRVKLSGTLMFIISLFLVNNFVGYIAAILFLIFVIKLSKVPVSFMLKGLKSIFFILIFTAFINMLCTPGIPVFSFWKISITKEGIRVASFLIVRLVLLVIGSSVMTLTTTPSNLTDGLEKGLGWMKSIKVPVHEIAMMMSIALSFIPILLEELDIIMRAQQARGADFESGGPIKRAKAIVPILVPLFVSAFRRANELALAMESRCYRGGEGRTKLHPLKYKGADIASYIVMIVYLLCIIGINIGSKIYNWNELINL